MVMMVKYLKLYLIHKEQKYYQLVLIKLQEYGMLRAEMFYKFYKVIKMKYFHVCLIMKVIQLLQVQKIIHVKFGEIFKQ